MEENTIRTNGRSIARVVSATETRGPLRLIGTVDCDGAGTRHPLPEVDPFIFLDAGVLTKDGMPTFGPHPHRGHSVVTILLRGTVQSWDSTQQPKHQSSNVTNRPFRDVITGPASYWVDAGTGLFHEEVTKIEDETDPTQHVQVFQLWVGVSEADRQLPPRIQIDTNLPTFDCIGYSPQGMQGQTIVVGHGRYYVGSNTSIETTHPVCVAHITQKAGTVYEYPIVSSTHGGFVVHIKGNTKFGDSDTAVTPKHEYDVLVLQNNNNHSETKIQGSDFLRIETSDDDDSEYLICTGERIGESWAKKLVANGAIIAATPEQARAIAFKVESKSRDGPDYTAFDESMSQQSDIADLGGGGASADPSTASIPPTPAAQQQTGIDIRKALEILSTRTPHSHASHDHDNSRDAEKMGCCGIHGDEMSENLKQMGQTIDMLGQAAPPSTAAATIETSHERQAQEAREIQEQQKEKAAQHKKELAASLKGMTQTSDLIRVLLRAQEDRVKTYQTYDAALQQVLKTGNLTAYPPACALATASFSMLSDTIRAVVDEMASRTGSSTTTNNNLKQYGKWTEDLQALEKEKLQLTAALHLEKIRANNEKDKAVENSVLRMLREGIVDLEHKMQKCVSEINAILEDLQCALVDEIEEEDEEEE
ncbi:DNA repair REX1-B [Nitzschia inconspicua]|uniref:DNA repair REX1-B n=1 Tax=Nitzschia inconspicua TaxID=303405 RepID=A0A9K3PQY6_9STRA|nr:DNA repair REX1-B [Nitzschia inconspicua]